MNLMQPRNAQRILTGEIQKNGRLIDPTAISDFRTNANNEFKKAIAFHTVLLEVENMKDYYSKLRDEPERIQPKLSEGCFTSDFVSVILQHTPENEMMSLVGHLVHRDLEQVKIE